MVQPASKRLVTEATVGAHVATQVTTPGSATATALTTTIAEQVDAAGAGVSGPGWIAIGDSMTFGSGGGGTTYPSVITSVTGLEVINAGIQAEKSSDIAGRQGGSPLIATITGGSIPASGAVALTVTRASDGAASADFNRLNSYQVNPVSIAGVLGTITNTTGTYSFTRTTAGTSVLVNRPTPIYTKQARDYRKRGHIIFMGTNNPLEKDQVLGDIESVIQNMDASQKRYVIVGPFNRLSQPSGSPEHTSILAIEKQLAITYGRRFINGRKYLIEYGLADASLSPTATDTTDISNDVIPTSLRSDSTHLTPAGYTVLGKLIAARMIEFGWATGTVAPVDPRLSAATFTASDGTALTSYTPEVGPVWGGTAGVITSNMLRATAANTMRVNVGTGNVQVSVDVATENTVTPALGVVVRADAAATKYLVAQFSAGNLSIRSQNGSTVILATVAFPRTIGVTNRLSVKVTAANVVEAYVDGVLKLTHPLTTLESDPFIGFTSVGLLQSAATTAGTWDNFEAVPA